MGQSYENDNNQNRAYETVDKSIKRSFSHRSDARLKNKLYDAYVRFFRWGMDRLQDRDGIVCLVTNNSFLDQIAFDGMRKSLAMEFSQIHHLDLRGNVRQNPKFSGTGYNVFGIQVGVGITVGVRKCARAKKRISLHRLPVDLPRYAKLAWLADNGSLSSVSWKRIAPDERGNWLVLENRGEFSELVPLGTEGLKAGEAEDAVFRQFSLGVVTNRDEWVYGDTSEDVARKTRRLIQNYTTERARLALEERGSDGGAATLNSDPTFIKWTDRLKEAAVSGTALRFNPDAIRRSLYRPFTLRNLYFDHLLNQRRYLQHYFFPQERTERENRGIAVTSVGSEKPFMALAVETIADLHLVGAGAGTQCFPYYTYDQDGTNRRDNITDWALDRFRTQYKDKKITKWNIFHYVYGILHHPGYRETFAENLKRELPRIPFAPDFRAFAAAGEKLAKLHLDYESLKPWKLDWIYTDGVPLSYRVEKMKLSKDKTSLTVNPSLTLGAIPPEAFAYRLGNRSALEWVVDQYQVHTDPRSKITSDPNREDDEEYIVRLVGQVVRVSIETVRIVEGLPKEFR